LHKPGHWRDYDPIALAMLFLSVGVVLLAFNVP
jgi:hypothetical protein